jgi:hypothetical protein
VKTNNRSRAQRARRDAEREADPRAGPPIIPHGVEIGSITIRMHGQEVTAKLLQAGEKCRTLGVSIDGGPVELLGLYRAAVAVSAKIARMPPRRSDFWDGGGYSAKDEAGAQAAGMGD